MSLTRKIIASVMGLSIVGFGFCFGIIPIFRILTSLINGEQVHGNLSLYALSLPLIPLGVWVLFTTFRRQ